MTISVIVPILNSRPYLQQCLDSILAAAKNYGTVELIVIDNGSTDGSYELLLSSYGLSATVLQVKNATISALRNLGAQIARGEYLSFIDSDCAIPNDYFHRVTAVFSSVDADAAGCMYDLPPRPHWIEKTWQALHEHPKDGYVNFVNSGNFVVKRAVFEKSAGFDEKLITGEDSEYCQRLNTVGFKIYESHAIPAVHLGNPKTLPAFFRKQAWHGLGMFGTFRRSWLDKPVLMTFMFLLCFADGVAGLFLLPLSLGTRIAALASLTMFAPALTVAYRVVRRGGLYRPLRSVLLYWIYYAARSYALLLVMFRRVHVPATT